MSQEPDSTPPTIAEALGPSAQHSQDRRRRITHRLEGRDQDERVLPRGRIEGAVHRYRQPATRDWHFAVDRREFPAIGRTTQHAIGATHGIERRRKRQKRKAGEQQQRDVQRRIGMSKDHRFAQEKTDCAISCATLRPPRQVSRLDPETAMPLSMNRDVFITCAVTGAGDTVGASPHVPITPKRIAESAIDAAKAGAAVVHCHVRDPKTAAASRRRDLYREVTDRIRSADVDVVLNLTAGMGGDLVLGNVEAPLPVNKTGTDMAGATERVTHARGVPSRICTCRLRHHELQPWRLCHDQHAVNAARDGAADDGAWSAPGDRGVRHRSSMVRPAARSRRADRGPRTDPALHGHSLGRAGRP